MDISNTPADGIFIRKNGKEWEIIDIMAEPDDFMFSASHDDDFEVFHFSDFLKT